MLSGFKSRKGRQKCSWFPGLRLLRVWRRRLSFVPNGTRSVSYVKPSVKTLGYFLFSFPLVNPALNAGLFSIGTAATRVLVARGARSYADFVADTPNYSSRAGTRPYSMFTSETERAAITVV